MKHVFSPMNSLSKFQFHSNAWKASNTWDSNAETHQTAYTVRYFYVFQHETNSLRSKLYKTYFFYLFIKKIQVSLLTKSS